jgi:fumarate reductase subunit C
MSRQPYIRPMSKTTWYMRNKRYKVYMLREMTCLLVGFYSFLAIFALAALAEGSPERWNGFLASQQNPAMIAFHGIALIYFLVYQTFAWFELAPKAMPVQLGEKKLPDSFIVVAHYAAWAVLSAFIFWLAGVF